jgi:hypothetical protein
MSSIRALIVIFLGAGIAFAQYVSGARAGTINLTVGETYLDDQPIKATSTNFGEMKEGQLLRTGNGRAELLLGPGVFFRLGPVGTVRLTDARVSEATVELLSGSAVVEVVEATKENRVQVKWGSARTTLRKMGVYRFESKPCELRVYGGEAEVYVGEKHVGAGKGRTVKVDGMPAVSKFNTNDFDDLHKWAAGRSFDLFVASGDAVKLARRKFFKEPTNWILTSTRWLWNPDFGMRFYSQVVAQEVVDQEAEDKLEQRQLEQNKPK